MNPKQEGVYLANGSILCKNKHKEIYEAIKRNADEFSKLFPQTDVKSILEEEKKERDEKERDENG